jgi:NAD(P)-dependent dehydrogenase (short-subunit alcohol dehydrogenase family)
VHHLTKNAAVTYVKRNIRVYSIRPGIIHTPMMDEMDNGTVAWVVGQTPPDTPDDRRTSRRGRCTWPATSQGPNNATRGATLKPPSHDTHWFATQLPVLRQPVRVHWSTRRAQARDP